MVSKILDKEQMELLVNIPFEGQDIVDVEYAIREKARNEFDGTIWEYIDRVSDEPIDFDGCLDIITNEVMEIIGI